jgi:putative flavoprotein involved in K+ transport
MIEDGVQHLETVVVGGGQAGLAVGYYLARAGRSFVILDANERVGDPWRHRWDSLRLFTPARYCGLPGQRFPGPAGFAPTKDVVADYLESYVERFHLPVRTGIRVDRVSRRGERFEIAAGDSVFDASQVVIATGAQQVPRIPGFSLDLDPSIEQLHSAGYRNRAQLREGGVLIVGAGNSGADISMDVIKSHPTWVSGRDPGHVPFQIDTFVGRDVLVRVVRAVGHHLLTLRTPVGRRARRKFLSQGGPVVRVKPKEMLAAGIVRVPKTVGAKGGLPLLEDGRVLDVANVIWCTGYRQELSWIDLPIFGEDGSAVHERGIVTSEPGVYLVGWPFQFSATSELLTGVTRDARFVAKHLLERPRSEKRASSVSI